MDMIGYQCPGKALGVRFANDGGKTIYEIRTIGTGPKDLSALDSAHDDMMHRPRRIDAGLTWHGEGLSDPNCSVKHKNIDVPSLFAEGFSGNFVLIGGPVLLEIFKELIPVGDLIAFHVAYGKRKPMVDPDDDRIVTF